MDRVTVSCHLECQLDSVMDEISCQYMVQPSTKITKRSKYKKFTKLLNQV